MTTGEDGHVRGMTVAGRYQLLASHGGRPPLRFWHAVEIATGREVGLTLVDTRGELPEEFVHEILARTIRLRGLGTSGIATVLDVLHTGAYGVVVSEWISGGSLRQVADTRPAPSAVAAMMQSLAAAAEAAHRAGLVLSVDDPARLRVSDDGHVALAFPAILPEAGVQADLRGIGCALYALLLLQWPAAGQPAEPADVDPEIPFLLSTTTTALFRENGGIANAATLLHLLEQAGVESEPDSNCRIMPPLAPPRPGGYAGFRNFGREEQKDVARRLVIRGGLGAAAAVILVAVLALASSLNGLLGSNDDTVAMDADKLGLLPPTATPGTPGAPPPTKVGGVTPGDPVALAAAGVFSPDGSPDSPGEAGLAIDGKPDTAWSTDRYYDPDPFPKFKTGVGLIVSLREPTPVSAVTVDLNSTGTVIQVRSALNAEPKALADTVELTPPTPVRPGANRIPITDSRPVSRVVVWISTLGSADGQHRMAISEIGVHAASAPA